MAVTGSVVMVFRWDLCVYILATDINMKPASILETGKIQVVFNYME